jgi:hypothetical protein
MYVSPCVFRVRHEISPSVLSCLLGTRRHRIYFNQSDQDTLYEFLNKTTLQIKYDYTPSAVSRWMCLTMNVADFPHFRLSCESDIEDDYVDLVR